MQYIREADVRSKEKLTKTEREDKIKKEAVKQSQSKARKQNKNWRKLPA